MLSRLSNLFHAWAKGWLILALVAAFAVCLSLTLPGVQAVTGEVEPLDTRDFYTPETAFSTIASYTDAARGGLRIYYLTGDIANPVFYALILGLLISWLFQRGFQPESPMQKLNVIPVGALFFDVLENIGLVILLSVYPARPAIVAWLSAVCTLTKYLHLYGSVLLILIGLVQAARNRFGRRHQVPAVEQNQP